jgi:hypothetical protein
LIRGIARAFADDCLEFDPFAVIGENAAHEALRTFDIVFRQKLP